MVKLTPLQLCQQNCSRKCNFCNFPKSRNFLCVRRSPLLWTQSNCSIGIKWSFKNVAIFLTVSFFDAFFTADKKTCQIGKMSISCKSQKNTSFSKNTIFKNIFIHDFPVDKILYWRLFTDFQISTLIQSKCQIRNH